VAPVHRGPSPRAVGREESLLLFYGAVRARRAAAGRLAVCFQAIGDTICPIRLISLILGGNLVNRFTNDAELERQRPEAADISS
jgi:hypothetical protein